MIRNSAPGAGFRSGIGRRTGGGRAHHPVNARRPAGHLCYPSERRAFTASLGLIVVIVCFCSLVTMGAPPALEDGPAAHGQLAEAASILFKKNDWASIETQAQELRETRARFLDGEWKLHSFYQGLSPAYWGHNEHDWQASLTTKHQAWLAAFPQSITERVAHGEALTDYAWQARGAGFANTVTKEAFQLFEERLAEARKVLEQAEALPTNCPEWSSAMLMIGLGQNWERKEYDRIYKQAVEAEPTYYSYYVQKLTHLLPRWAGEPGEWQRFAEQAAREDDPAEGLTVLARIYIAALDYGEVTFEAGDPAWKKVARGLLDILERYPRSTSNARNFFRLCRSAGDREFAKQVLAKVGDQPDVTAWGTLGQFETARLWAEGKEGPGPRTVLDPDDQNPANCLAFSPDDRLLAVGGNEGQVLVWDLKTKKVAWQPTPNPLRVSSVAFSPDSKLLAIGHGEDQASTSLGEAAVWDVTTRKQRAIVPMEAGQVYAVQFSQDGRKLVVAGGVYDKLGEARVWDVQSGETRKLEWTPPHTHCFKTVALSPDGRALALECNRSINVIAPADNKILLQSKQTLASWVRSVAFAPDGKLVAAVTARSWTERAQPGALVLWDVEGWAQRKPMPATSGLLSVAFMPDGRFIVTGGYDSVIRFWDVEAGQESAQLRGHLSQVNAVAVSPDGRTVASAAQEGVVWLWDPPAVAARE